MTRVERKVVWEKWKDPYSETDEWFPLSKPEKATEEASFEEIEEEDIFEQPIQQILLSNMGVMPVNNHIDIGKIFNFWTAHTSFSISPNIANRIETVEGVEVLDIYTRYRFRVGIGKLFTDRDVMNAIQQAICTNE